MMQIEWNIKSRSNTCQASGVLFQEGDFFYTLLFRNDAGYERQDVSEASWEEQKDDASKPVPFSLWRSKYELPPPPLPETLAKDDAEGMLRYLLASNNPQHLKACYILALMLERKKILKPLEGSDDSTLFYEHASTGETFIVKDPHLSLENLLEVQQEVADLLAGITTPPKNKTTEVAVANGT